MRQAAFLKWTQALVKTGQLSKAMKQLGIFREKFPDDPLLADLISLVASVSPDDSLVQEYLDSVSEDQVKIVYFYFCLGRQMHQLGNFADAEKYLTTAIDMMPRFIPSLDLIGLSIL